MLTAEPWPVRQSRARDSGLGLAVLRPRRVVDGSAPVAEADLWARALGEAGFEVVLAFGAFDSSGERVNLAVDRLEALFGLAAKGIVASVAEQLAGVFGQLLMLTPPAADGVEHFGHGAFLRGEGSPNAKRGAPAPLVSRGFGVAPRALGGRGRYVTAPGGDLGSHGRGAALVPINDANR